jgi:hypothetical protein
MFRRYALQTVTVASLALVGACSQAPQGLVSPSAVGGSSAANPDGSTLKVSAPGIIAPAGGERQPTRRPVLTFTNSTGRFTSLALSYRVELLDGTGNFLGASTAAQGEGGQTAFQGTVDLTYDTDYQWRVRAEFDGQAGPWSATAAFKTPVQPVAGGAFTGGVGAQRAIFINEALAIIIRIHDDLRVDLSTGESGAQYRRDFFAAAVAAIHYGHPRFNSAGPDPSWCIKDAGQGRPQSDETIVLCSSREAWDLIGGNGARGYRFHLDALGRLPSIQNVYPPPARHLNWLNR